MRRIPDMLALHRYANWSNDSARLAPSGSESIRDERSWGSKKHACLRAFPGLAFVGPGATWPGTARTVGPAREGNRSVGLALNLAILLGTRFGLAAVLCGEKGSETRRDVRHNGRSMGTSAMEEAVIARMKELPPEQQEKVLDFARRLKVSPALPLRSLEGLWSGEVVEISESEIADLRKEMWSNFPRDDY